MERRSRQGPLSCRLCRSMKLKCNREFPCSNCISRNVVCEKAQAATSTPRTSKEVPKRSNDEILSRLRRLEDLILNSPAVLTTAASPTTDATLDTGSSQTAEPAPISEETGISRWLEGVGIREHSMLSGLSSGFLLRIVPCQSALEDENISANLQNQPEVTWLPSKLEAFWLLDYYKDHVSHFHHIIHIPSVRSSIDTIYEQIRLEGVADPAKVALLLSLFASTAHKLSVSAEFEVIFGNYLNTVVCVSRWSKAALDMLEYCRRTTPGSLEDVQATIIMSFLIFQLEGFTTRFRTLTISALSIARDLSLHRTDAEMHPPNTPVDNILIEVKRRVWWHIVSTDWLLALTAGPQEGTYMAHPNHMRVNLPSNTNDDDEFGQQIKNLSQPSTMTYTLLRIRLAEICRATVDALPFPLSLHGNVNYDKIIMLDKQFESFLQSLPSFFRLNAAGRDQDPVIERQFPQISSQRYILWGTFYSRRFKLNQPFLTRSTDDNRYKYSKDVCLQSARGVIDIKKQMESASIISAISPLRQANFLHIFLLATGVLVMELCFQPKGQRDQDLQLEVFDACHMLQEVSDGFPDVSKFLKSLSSLFQRHGILNIESSAPGWSSGGVESQLNQAYLSPRHLHVSGMGSGMADELEMAGSSTENGNTGEYVPNHDAITMSSQNATNWDEWFTSLDNGGIVMN